MSVEVFRYTIDQDDRIVAVGDNWQRFASDNGAGDALRPGQIIGRSIWDFIEGDEIRHLYEVLFRRARAGHPPRELPFRCDAPGLRRDLTLHIEAMPGDLLQITSTIHETRARSPVRLLDAGTPRSEEFVLLCSMCKDVRIELDQWRELEEGVAHLHLLDSDVMPRLSHGLCPACHRSALEDLLNDSAAS